MFTISQLADSVSYDPNTGKLRWKGRTEQEFEAGVRTPSQKAVIFNAHYEGNPAFSSKTSNGYLAGTFFGVAIKAHRAAWAIHYGTWPKHHIDHVNGDRSDNRISNLRAATFAENAQNKEKYRIANSTSKYKGVSKQGNKWKSTVNANGKRTYIGLFDDETVAAVAYDLVASVLHGDFFKPNIENDKDAMADFATEYARKNHKTTPMTGVRVWETKESF